jgi:hypothetical protein
MKMAILHCLEIPQLAWFELVRTFKNSLNPELNSQVQFGHWLNLELNFRFSSGRFRFEPKFRTELSQHY